MACEYRVLCFMLGTFAGHVVIGRDLLCASGSRRGAFVRTVANIGGMAMLFDVNGRARSGPRYASDLTPEIQTALAALADVETRYEIERDRLRRSARKTHREDLLQELEDRHQAERGPLVQRLAELQQAMTSAMMCREAGLKLSGPTRVIGVVEVTSARTEWPNLSIWWA